MFKQQTACEAYLRLIRSCDLSDDYKAALIRAVRIVLDPKIVFASCNYSEISNKLVSAQSHLRGARGKATFDDLCELNYPMFENTVLSINRAMLLRTVSGNRERCVM